MREGVGGAGEGGGKHKTSTKIVPYEESDSKIKAE